MLHYKTKTVSDAKNMLSIRIKSQLSNYNASNWRYLTSGR